MLKILLNGKNSVLINKIFAKMISYLLINLIMFSNIALASDLSCRSVNYKNQNFLPLIIWAPAQALDLFGFACRENISPSIYIQDSALQQAFIRKLDDEALFDTLQENGWSIAATARALGTYPSEISRKTSPEQIVRKKGEYRAILKSLIKNKFSLEKVKKDLGIGRKKIIKAVGKEFIEQGRKEQREREIELERQMVLCALEAFDWNVSRTSEETGIWIKRIRELVPTEVIQENRQIAQDQLKQLMMKVLEANNWVVTDALKDQRLIDREVGKHLFYRTLTIEWIDEQRVKNTEQIEEKQKQELIHAITLFMHNRKCLEEAGNYLGLPKGTLNDRLRKYGITVDGIRYDPQRIIPILIKTKANLTQTAKILEVDRQRISLKFPEIIALIKNNEKVPAWIYVPEQIQKRQELIEVIERFIDKDNSLTQASEYLGMSLPGLKKKMKRYDILLVDLRLKAEKVIPVLKQTKGNTTEAAKRLKSSRENIRARFGQELENIRTEKKLEDQEAQEKEKQELIDAIKKFARGNGYTKKVAEYLGIEEKEVSLRIAKHGINVQEMKYHRERVLPVLEKTFGNVSETARMLGVTYVNLIKEYSSEIEHQRAKVKERRILIQNIEKQQLIGSIKKFLNSRGYIKLVAEDLNLSPSVVKTRIAKYEINFQQLKTSRERVLPVLIRKEGVLVKSAGELGLRQETIRKSYSPEIGQIRSVRQRIVYVIKRFEILDQGLKSFEKRINRLHIDDPKEINIFHTVMAFTLFRGISMLDGMLAEVQDIKDNKAIVEKIKKYKYFFERQYDMSYPKINNAELTLSIMEQTKLEIKSFLKNSCELVESELVQIEMENMMEKVRAETWINNSI